MKRRSFCLSGLLLPSLVMAEKKQIRIALPSPGTAGSLWKPLIENLGANALKELPDIEWVVSDPGAMQVQLIAGSLDVGFFGPIGLALLRARGNDILLFGPGTSNHSVWLVKKSSDFRSIEDLKGRRIATQPESSETYQQAKITALLHGLDLKKDFKTVLGSPMANLAMFERGDVDALIMLEPNATRLVASHARELVRVGDLWRQKTGDAVDPFLVGLAARRSWIDANLDTARQLSQLFAKANQQVREQPEILKRYAHSIGIKADETAAIDLLAQRMRTTYTANWNASTWQGIEKQLELAVKAGILSEKPHTAIFHSL